MNDAVQRISHPWQDGLAKRHTSRRVLDTTVVALPDLMGRIVNEAR